MKQGIEFNWFKPKNEIWLYFVSWSLTSKEEVLLLIILRILVISIILINKIILINPIILISFDNSNYFIIHEFNHWSMCFLFEGMGSTEKILSWYPTWQWEWQEKRNTRYVKLEKCSKILALHVNTSLKKPPGRQRVKLNNFYSIFMVVG